MNKIAVAKELVRVAKKLMVDDWGMVDFSYQAAFGFIGNAVAKAEKGDYAGALLEAGHAKTSVRDLEIALTRLMKRRTT